MSKQRFLGPDILRTVAICAVFSVHMISITGGCDFKGSGLNDFIRAFLLFFGRCGVPLFLLLTGFLQCRREINKKHYLSIIPVLLSYYLISLITLLVAGSNDLSADLLSILGFRYGYAWYVEMYVGLFLIIPFLNILFNALCQKQQRLLILLLLVITLLPATVKNFIVDGRWFDIVPDFFDAMYPITYFFIGAYIAKYRPRLPAWCAVFSALLLAGATLVKCSLATWEYQWHIAKSYTDLLYAAVTVILFLSLYQVQGAPKWVRLPLTEISVCSFEMYLLSNLSDRYMYNGVFPSIYLALVVNFAGVYVAARLLRLAVVPLSKRLDQFVQKMLLIRLNCTKLYRQHKKYPYGRLN